MSTPRVPTISNWKKTPKERGRRQGRMWPTRLSPTGYFYIFANPNREAEGPIREFYLTDGDQILSQGHRTRGEAVRGLKHHLRSDARRVNPLTEDEQREVLARGAAAGRQEKKYRKRGMLESAAGYRAMRDAYDEVADDFGPEGLPTPRAEHIEAGGMPARRRDWNPPGPEVVVAPRTLENPLTEEEAEEELAHAQRQLDVSDRIELPRGRAYAAGMARGTLQSVQRHGPEGAKKRATDMILESGTKKVGKKKKRRKNPVSVKDSKAKFKHKSIRPEKQFVEFRYAPASHADPEDLKKALKKAKLRKLPKGGKLLMGKFKASVTRGRPKGTRVKYLAWGIKSILIPKKGKRKNPARKTRPEAKKRPVKHSRKKSRPKARKNHGGVCRHTLKLERGSKSSATVCYPKKIFSSLEDAVRDIQRELRAKFGQLAKAPKISRAEWKYSDKAKTKGRWHFTAKKR